MKRTILLAASATLSVALILLAGCSTTEKFTKVTEKLPVVGSSGVLADNKPVFFVVEINGQRRSHGYRVRKHTAYRNFDAILTETVQTTEVIRNSTRYVQNITRKVITATDGAALYSTEVTLSGGEKKTKTVTISDGFAEFESYGAGETENKKVPVPRGVMFGIEPDWLLHQRLRVGQTLETTVLDKASMELVTQQATVRAFRTEEVLGESYDVWEVVLQRNNGMPTRMTFTTEGHLVRLEADTMLVRMTTKEEAERDAVRMEIVSTVPTDFPLPAWDNYSEIVFSAEPAYKWMQFVKPSEYVRTEDNGSSVKLTLTKVAPRLKTTLFPMEPPSTLRPYLASTPMILASDRSIRKRARTIIDNETNVLRAVARLAGWVNKTIEFNDNGSMNQGPLKTIERQSGDCSEHADLFASLARSIGIPTRHCLGLLIQSENAVYHTWVEAWIGGTWIPVDTTVNRVGLPAGYILTARGTGNGQPSDPFAWAIRERDLGLRMQSATHIQQAEGLEDAAFTLLPQEKKSFVAFRDNWLANIYWGFALTKPNAWEGQIKLKSVTITSPDKRASIKVEAMERVFHVNPSTLDAIVDNLERTMEGYRTIKARNQLFGTSRKSASLFVDFSCQQEGARLRCQQYIVPKRGRSYRISVWAPEDEFANNQQTFQQILDSIEL